jgi:hypothetical protein
MLLSRNTFMKRNLKFSLLISFQFLYLDIDLIDMNYGKRANL